MTKHALSAAGLPVFESPSHIVPKMVNDAKKCRAAIDLLMRRHGIYIQPINYPTAPRGEERLRIMPIPRHTREHLALLVEALVDVWRTLDLPFVASNVVALPVRAGERAALIPRYARRLSNTRKQTKVRPSVKVYLPQPASICSEKSFAKRSRRTIRPEAGRRKAKGAEGPLFSKTSASRAQSQSSTREIAGEAGSTQRRQATDGRRFSDKPVRPARMR